MKTTKTKSTKKWLESNGIEYRTGHDFFDDTPTIYISLDCYKPDKWGKEYLSVDLDLAGRIQQYAKRAKIKLEYRASYTAIALIPE